MVKVGDHPFRGGQLRCRLVGAHCAQCGGDEGLHRGSGGVDRVHAALLERGEYPVRPGRPCAVLKLGHYRFRRCVREPGESAELGGEACEGLAPCFWLLSPGPEGEAEAEDRPAVAESLDELGELRALLGLLQALGCAGLVPLGFLLQASQHGWVRRVRVHVHVLQQCVPVAVHGADVVRFAAVHAELQDRAELVVDEADVAAEAESVRDLALLQVLL